MSVAALEGGFRDGPIDAAHAFRAVMNAMARPGQIQSVAGVRPPAPLSVAAGVVVLTLCDPDTPIYLTPSYDTPAVRDWITFHTGAPLAAPGQAAFALGPWDELPIGEFSIGTPEYPDRSATLIVEMPKLANEGCVLTGPGIKDETFLGLPDPSAFQTNALIFPLGLDFLFTCGDRLAGLPRSTKVS